MKNKVLFWFLCIVSISFSEALIIAKNKNIRAIKDKKRALKREKKVLKKELRSRKNKKKSRKKSGRPRKEKFSVWREKRIGARKIRKQKMNAKHKAWKEDVRRRKSTKRSRAIERAKKILKPKQIRAKGREGRKRKWYKEYEFWKQKILHKNEASKQKMELQHEIRAQLKEQEAMEFKRAFETGETKINIMSKEYDILQSGEMQTKFLRYIEKSAKAIEFLFFDPDSEQIIFLKNILSTEAPVSDKIKLVGNYRLQLIKTAEFRKKVEHFRLTWNPDKYELRSAKEFVKQVFDEVNGRIDKFKEVSELPLISI